MSLLVVTLLPTETASSLLKPVTLQGQDGKCSLQEERESAIQNITASVRAIVREKYFGTIQNSCGEGLWYKVADLNMSDTSQQCPSAWREYSESGLGIRTCRRPLSLLGGSCGDTFYVTEQQYSKVCGRAIGYQIGSTEAFWHLEGIDLNYVFGISVTHGEPRNHMWTFASGLSEGAYIPTNYNCPCSDPTSSDNQSPPLFVGDNYYCESGNPTNTYISDHLYSSDPLWDGQQCEGECCSNGKSPPWFSVELPNPTTDDIEVRICSAHHSTSDDDVALQLLEIFIQ